MVCHMKKSLYGLKQTSKQWNAKFIEALLHASFKQSKYDYSLFTKKEKVKIVVLLVYVDDLQIMGNVMFLIDDLKKILNQNFKMDDLKELK
ncbi:hypothetical protein GQ457_04G011190 [Hibiscus cannabinus]